MFCPVGGNEENEPLIVNGAKVCHKCGCVIEKAEAAVKAKPKKNLIPVFICIIIIVIFNVVMLIIIDDNIENPSSPNKSDLLISFIPLEISILIVSIILSPKKNK